MRRIRSLLLIFVSISYLPGCMNIKQRVLDDIQLATAASYEHIEEDTLQNTVVFPNFQTDKTVKNVTLTAKASLSKEIRDKHSLQSDRPIVSGKIEVLLYEKKTAEKGIINLLDTVQRDPSVGLNVYLVVAESNPKELLSKQYGNIDTGMFLSNLIEQNIETGLIHKTNIHQFLYKYYSQGIDPMLPMIKQKDGKIQLHAIGLFDNDKLVDQIDEGKFFFVKILVDSKSENDSYEVKFGEGEKASIFNINSKRKFDIPKPMTNSEITITLKLKSSIREYTNGKLTMGKMKELEQILEKDIKKKSVELIKRFQEKGIDPIGIGNAVKTKTRQWDEKKWDELYLSIPINVNVSVDILESGIIN
ncbi:spore germination protein [Cytobacillus eiseniae]|uniref:Spore germination protein n=1 Tax=Cytobacillus eiseniae TaxID=762947 RepID=A0ABS4R9T6_9BACI|nr:Ger(x)C family spore germination protein [Cytobacillus eiseniae]MBP2239658.1 spore germination protein [Cytobacillus eiseniae]